MQVRALVAAATLATFLFAGCAGKGIDCPDAYGPEFEEAYKKVIAQLEEDGISVPPDSDGDCIADVAEQAIGTDPQDGESFPTMEQLQGMAPGGTGPTAPPPPPPVYTWKEETVTQDFASIPLLASGAAGATFTFDVPRGATMVYLNVTARGTTPDEFNLEFDDPDGETHTITTARGVASLLVEEPADGEWRTWIYSRAAPNSGSITLQINAYVPVEAETEDEPEE